MSPDLTPRKPVLRAEFDPRQPGPVAVTVSALSAPQQAALDHFVQTGGSLQDLLHVRIAASDDDDQNFALPSIAGRHQIVADGLRFQPHFPPQPGVLYRAMFHPKLLGDEPGTASLSVEFSIPELPPLSPAVVEQIYPSAECLPENLLRLYVTFSRPMWRGCARQHIHVLGPDGEPAPDVLYRAPVELWDRGMQTLTILLDPGRLKRGVGPNRELGPPLVRGLCYTLVVGAGMLDGSGRPLARSARKRFRVSAPVREPIAVEQWQLSPPAADTADALLLQFRAPLDWALLASAISIHKAAGERVEGDIRIDQEEARWALTPTTPWAAGNYTAFVGCDLEDVCGNTPVAPFDRPLRPRSGPPHEERPRRLDFHVT